MSNPTIDHWQVVKHILCSLKQTLSLGLSITHSLSQHLHSFSDVEWAGCTDDHKSSGGYVIYMGNNLISWSARKQCPISWSSRELKYHALLDATAEIIWLQTLFKERGVLVTNPPILWCDNIGATYLTANPIFHAPTKHIEIDFHFVHDHVSKKNLQVSSISTKDQIADNMMKALPHSQFLKLRNKLCRFPT